MLKKHNRKTERITYCNILNSRRGSKDRVHPVDDIDEQHRGGR